MSWPSEQAYVELFQSTFDPLWRFVRRRVPSADDADDVTAEVFTVAWRRRNEWPPADQRKLWLYGVARHVVKTHQRSIHRQDRLAGRLIDLGEVGPKRAEAGVPDDSVWRALARLDAADRELLIMRAWDRLTLPDIAELLGCTTNAASIRLTRARAKLRAELDALGSVAEDRSGKEQLGDGHEDGNRPREETNQ